jgi:hypothetical protein
MSSGYENVYFKIPEFLNFFPQVDAVTQELKLTVIRGREQRDKLLLEVDRLKQARFFCRILCTNDIIQRPFLY